MRLSLNENMPATLIAALREAGHDVLSVEESMHGASDTEVLNRAQTETRIVVTQDKGFGELAFRHGLPAQCGIVHLRLTSSDREACVRHMLEILTDREDWPGHIAVVSDDRVRMRPLIGKPPPPAQD